MEYVNGFLFCSNGVDVALIQKNRPEWMKGKWNGIGGKIEPGETSEVAMRREFFEETGVDVHEWKKFCVMNTAMGYTIHFFYAKSEKIYEVSTTTDERVSIVPVDNLPYGCLPNIEWELAMAMSMWKGETIDHFIVTEVGR